MARRPPRPSEDDRRLWKRVARTVTPQAPVKSAYVANDATEAALQEAARAELAELMGEVTPVTKGKTRASKRSSAKTASVAMPTAASVGLSIKPVAKHPADKPPPEELEPRRKRRLSRERDPIEARLDLHGFGRFEAEDQLRAFLMTSQARGLKAVLVITGQGRRGGGVIRASIQEWLASPYLRLIVSGYSVAHQKHGGDGAFYITLRQR
ncbi:Smr/MutS family protein [Brevundimonas sp. BH3]|uniref:Smr/MutS family protein n=1 Tax=Brevundimonas sp. BH3 TaxID=3133089 RepID=UPI003248502C